MALRQSSRPIRMAWFVSLGLAWIVHVDARGAEPRAPRAGTAEAGDFAEILPAQYTEEGTADYAPMPPSSPLSPGLGMDILPREPGWFNASYILWVMKTQPMSVPVASDGVNTLLGDRPFRDRTVDGFRIDTGRMLDDEQTFGVEAGFLMFFENAVRSTVSTETSPLNRPFFGVTTGLPGNFPVAVPGTSAGFVSQRPDGFLVGAEFNAFYRAYQSEYESFDLIAGYRNVDLLEKVDVMSATNFVAGTGSFNGTSFAAPGNVVIRDQVRTSNVFNGGQIGARYQTGALGILLSGYGKVAFGTVNEEATLAGTTAAAGPAFGASPHVTNGGFLVTRDNSGAQSRSLFAVVPEVGINVSYEVTHYIVIGAGYSVFYINNVARPGNQLNRRIDQTAVPASPTFGPVHPGEQFTRVFNSSDFWAQGLNLSLTCRY